VDTAINQKIARETEQDYEIDTHEEEPVVENEIKTREGGVEEGAGCDEEKPPM
jgi:hypothetical protein